MEIELYIIISAPDKERIVKCFYIKYQLFKDYLFNPQNIIIFMGYSKRQNNVFKIPFLYIA